MEVYFLLRNSSFKLMQRYVHSDKVLKIVFCEQKVIYADM